MKFKVDENLPTEISNLLQAAGYDALTVIDQEMGGAQDAALLDACKNEGRILVTLDLDFADITAYPPRAYPGIIVLRALRQDKDHLMALFRKAIRRLHQERVERRLWIVEETRIRIHDAEQ